MHYAFYGLFKARNSWKYKVNCLLKSFRYSVELELFARFWYLCTCMESSHFYETGEPSRCIYRKLILMSHCVPASHPRTSSLTFHRPQLLILRNPIAWRCIITSLRSETIEQPARNLTWPKKHKKSLKHFFSFSFLIARVR